MAFHLETMFDVSVSVTKACAHCRCVSKNIPSLHMHPTHASTQIYTVFVNCERVVNRTFSRWYVTLL